MVVEADAFSSAEGNTAAPGVWHGPKVRRSGFTGVRERGTCTRVAQEPGRSRRLPARRMSAQGRRGVKATKR